MFYLSDPPRAGAYCSSLEVKNDFQNELEVERYDFHLQVDTKKKAGTWDRGARTMNTSIW